MPTKTISPAFDLNFRDWSEQALDAPVPVMRVTAPNGGPFTFHGTNSYVVGNETVAVIDPGPDDERHLAALLQVIGSRVVTHIVITHTHRDHSPLAARLKAATSAVTVGEGPHRYTGAEVDGLSLDASADFEFRPDVLAGNDFVIDCGGFALQAIATPGHAANHLCLAMPGTGILFSGDHVMGWATSIVAPPDGNMADYLTSLDRLAKRQDRIYLPGHGDPVHRPQRHVRALKAHRLARETAIFNRVAAGDETVGAIVAHVYQSTDKRLHGAAALTSLAHLERLVQLGKILADRPLGPDTRFKPA